MNKKGGMNWKLVGLILALLILGAGAYLIWIMVHNLTNLVSGDSPLTGCCSDCVSCPDEAACNNCGTNCKWEQGSCKSTPGFGIT